MFDPYTSVSIGPFQPQMQMLGLILALLVGFLILIKRLKRILPNERESIANQLQTSLIIAIVIYKCWPFILNPSLLKSFSHLIFYSGGPYAVMVAIAGGALWFGYQWWKHRWPLNVIDELALSAMFGWIAHLVVVKQYGSVSPFSFGWQKDGVVLHPVNLYEVLILAMFVFFAFYWVEQSKKGARTIYFLIAIILTQAVLAPF